MTDEQGLSLPARGATSADRRHSRLRKFAKWTGLTFLVGLLALVAAFFVAYSAIDIPSANSEALTQTTRVYYSDGKHLLGTFEVQNRESVPLSRVPDHVQAAVIAAEDQTFYDNPGLDVQGIVRAAWNNASTDSTQGASTITQQYVKVLYLTQERTWTRKVKEAFLSLKVQRQLSKNEILQGYLNTIYFGRGAYGVQAAAQAYFRQDVENLTVEQGAALAAILNSPANYDPREGRSARTALLARYRYVLDGMVEIGRLDATEADKVGRRLPDFPQVTRTDRFGGPQGYLLKLVEDELQRLDFTDADINGGGLAIITTLDYEDQMAAQKAVLDQQPDGLEQLNVALASIEPGTGALRAMYGGDDYVAKTKGAQINWALTGAQPGSSFKPFALIAGLRQGFSLEDTVDGSSPYDLPGGDDIENQGDSGGTSFGPVSLLTATRESINTAYIDLTLQMKEGPDRIVEAAKDAGVPDAVMDAWGDPPAVVTPLGYERVPTVDMADAYATIAAKGEQADWFAVEKVSGPDGEVLYSHKVRTERAFSADIAADVSYALQQVVLSGTGTNADIRCPAAGKTGTATGVQRGRETVSSSWFVGYTPQLATAVTYTRGDGNDQLAGYLPTFYGGEYPARTWQAYMSSALSGEDCQSFPPPAFVDGPAGTPSVAPTTPPPPPPTTSATSPPTTAPTTTATTPPPSTPTPTPSTPSSTPPPTTPSPTPTPTPTPTPSPTTSPTTSPTPPPTTPTPIEPDG
ncbi:MAG: transglycosylase domain-containing protein [Nocardioidaceae bacterium]